MIYYKIRKKDDPEMYVKGTPAYLSYDKTGRIFQTLGNLRSFLTSVMNTDGRNNRYGDKSDGHHNRIAEWEVVELEMVINEVKGVHEVLTSKKIKEMLMK
jgi:hypothetical protein